MKVLVACEFSGVVRRAFEKLGHDVVSCDLLPSEDGSSDHYEGRVQDIINDEKWDLMVACPPCTYLAVSGARWWKGREKEQRDAWRFVKWLWQRPIPRIAIENPIGALSTIWRKPDQIIQPWQFGHGETKATCLWLKGLPLLKPTRIVKGREARIHNMSPGPNRWKERSRTYTGIARAMAQQWGGPHPLLGSGPK